MNSPSPFWDVIISGVGIIGVSIAIELREHGAKVLVLDSAEPGREASSAAAGMLAPADPETPKAMRTLATASAEMFPEYVRKLEAAAGMQIDFRRVGTIALLKEAVATPEYKKISASELTRLEPAIQSQQLETFFVQEDSVDPHLLIQAALAAAKNQGVEIQGHSAVQRIHEHGGKIEVLTAAGPLVAKAYVNCQGAWSGVPIRPRKGQMLYVQPSSKILQHVLRTPEAYVVPRSNGKILIGATVEDMGFDKSVHNFTIQNLLNAAAKYLPGLAAAPITQSWAGLRPGTPDDLPIIGSIDIPNAFIASGHFRNGILLAPITAKIMAALVQCQPPPLDISAFSPARFSHKTA